MSEIRLVTRRYLWKIKDDDKINIKYVTDLLEGHNSFIESLCVLPNIEKATYEYISEYLISETLVVHDILKDSKEVSN